MWCLTSKRERTSVECRPVLKSVVLRKESPCPAMGTQLRWRCGSPIDLVLNVSPMYQTGEEIVKYKALKVNIPSGTDPGLAESPNTRLQAVSQRRKLGTACYGHG